MTKKQRTNVELVAFGLMAVGGLIAWGIGGCLFAVGLFTIIQLRSETVE